MIKKITFLALIVIFSATLISGITNGSQAPYGYTGSPTDADNCTACHAGTAQTDSNIVTNIPSSGYIAGTTYTITVNVSKAGIDKFGFQLTAEDETGVKVGDFVITDAAQTKLIQDEVTHTSLGTVSTNNQKTWNIDWTAPISGTGKVSFYTAINAANANSSTSGDIIILSALSVDENLSNAIGYEKEVNFVNIYPSLATNLISVEATAEVQQIAIYNTSGKLIYRVDGLDKLINEINVTDYPNGLYLVKIASKKGIKTLKFFKI